MQAIKLSMVSLIAVVGFVEPSLAQSNPKSKDEPKPVVKVTPKLRVIEIADGCTAANLYATDNTKSIVLTTLKCGDVVEELENDGFMMKVNFGGEEGWIHVRSILSTFSDLKHT